MNKDKNSELPYMSLFIGILLALIGSTGKIILGYAGQWRMSSISGGERWVLLLAGIIMIVLSIPFIRKQKVYTPKYTDEEAAQAKAKLEQMYLREYGSLPDVPKPETPARPAASQPEAAARPQPASAAPQPPTPEEKARIARANAKIRHGFLLMLAGGLIFYAANGVFLLIPATALLLVGLARLAVGLVERS